MNSFVLWFTKITGLIPQYFYFHKKIFYKNQKSQNRKIVGPALIVSNHFSIFDYALLMFVFFKRTIYVLVAKITMNKNLFMRRFVKNLGGICVNRKSFDFAFMSIVSEKLKKGKTVLIFPEARLKTKEELQKGDFLQFKPSFVYMALENNVPIIPIYVNGVYGFSNFFSGKRAKVMIGEKIFLNDMYDEKKSEKENVEFLCNYVRNYIWELKNDLEKREK